MRMLEEYQRLTGERKITSLLPLVELRGLHRSAAVVREKGIWRGGGRGKGGLCFTPAFFRFGGVILLTMEEKH